jgi:methylase of polypeptide subunit release factors
MSEGTPESLTFAGLSIAFDERVLRPRPWTQAQSRWAAALLNELPDGPVLELCSGAGHIGLAAVAVTGRRLVCVDMNPVAVEYSRSNARSAGLDSLVEVRQGRIGEALGTDELFPLVIADPPWVLSAETQRFPEDPRTAIDGGIDGLRVALECAEAIEGHLADGGAALLQLGSVDQVAALMSKAPESLRVLETRQFDGGVVAHLVRDSAPVQ